MNTRFTNRYSGCGMFCISANIWYGFISIISGCNFLIKLQAVVAMTMQHNLGNSTFEICTYLHVYAGIVRVSKIIYEAIEISDLHCPVILLVFKFYLLANLNFIQNRIFLKNVRKSLEIS